MDAAINCQFRPVAEDQVYRAINRNAAVHGDYAVHYIPCLCASGPKSRGGFIDVNGIISRQLHK